MRPSIKPVALALCAIALSACQTTQEELIASKKSALELRSIQHRNFETPDTAKVFRSVIAVMQDLGYAITTVEPEAGVVTGNKLAKLNLTASVTPKGTTATSVRANANIRTQHQVKTYHQVDDPLFYQQRFFDPLAQALFLDALYDDEAGPPKSLANEEAAPAKKQ